MNKYHWIPELPGRHHPRLDTTKLTASVLPKALDMAPHMSEIENQGQLGSCTGHAIVGLMEYLENKAVGFTNDHAAFIRLGRLFVYYNERLMEGTISKDAGALISDGMKSLVQYGICNEALFPYIEKHFRLRPPEQAYTDGLTRKIKSYVKVNQDQTTLMKVMAAGYPIVFGATIFESFESDEVERTGMVPMPQEGEKCLGGHAILMSGYDSEKGLVKVRNSWGPDWGDKGYCYFPFEYVTNPELADDLWTVYG